jgi:uncharacterized membrane protein YozB (DUF420 family)
MSHSIWPSVNASLNATSAVLLLLGYWCVRTRHLTAHTAFMLSACAVSILFLVSYLLYHAQVGSVRFALTGWPRPVYFTILISHTLLAIAIVPLAARTVYLGVRGRLVQHRGLARWTFPLWLYVCVSGVAVYWMLYRWK